ncbi:glyoxalase [Enterococcus florum]|uniref:Glyoxalase n=1 Tax=Enterococcus florum TaxID=2480627 RepID=A0A4P5PCW3_9ENTE|nr:VOC family protein [Enterococcus florum]GCF94374.1 glyoxalase [Enterococcus florum]
MTTMVFVNFPVADLDRSIAFYEALGFKMNKAFSTPEASAVVWDDHFWVMLLTHDFYQQFIQDKTIADPHTTSQALIAFSMDSAEEVRRFAEAAKQNGGNYYHIDMGIPEDQMFGLEVQDPDGNILEPNWMNMSN